MSIVGIGTDIFEIGRMQKSAENPSFMGRYFTPQECRLFSQKKGKGRLDTIAANFAAKEAAAKALGTGFSGFGPAHIEVLREPGGKPTLRFLEIAGEIAATKGIKKVHVSISHTKHYVTAFVVAES